MPSRNLPGYSSTINDFHSGARRRLPCAHWVQEVGRQPSIKEQGMIAVSKRCGWCGRAWVDYELDEPDPVWRTVVPPATPPLSDTATR
jgi:hypothetical protein